MRVHFVTINRSVPVTAALTGDQAYEAVGRNTGNLLFTDAVWSQVAWTEAESGYSFDPTHVNEWADAVVIPAANWLRPGLDLGDLAARIEQVKVPIIMIGLGAQADSDASIPSVSESVVRLVRAVASKSAAIGTRGVFSSLVLSRYGVQNSVPIGCPSLFVSPANARRLREVEPSGGRTLVGGTRYGLPRRELGAPEAKQRSLYRWAFGTGRDICIQSEQPEINLLVAARLGHDRLESTEDALASYYGSPSANGLGSYLVEHGRLFLDPADWHELLRSYDLYVGSRIHGAIASLVAGTPALLLTHDQRTTELAATASIPAASIDVLDVAQVKDWSRIVTPTMLEGFLSRRRELRARYASFLEANGLPHRLADARSGAGFLSRLRPS